MSQSKRLLPVFGLLALLALGSSPARADDPKPGEPPAPAESNDETRGYVGYGVELIEGLSAEDKAKNGIEREHGLYVHMISAGMPAQKAGLKAGDVLLKVNGQDVPDTSKVDPKDKDAVGKYLKDQFGKIVYGVKPGDTVTLVVDRAGRTETLKAVAVTKAEKDRLEEEAKEDEQAVQLPDWKKAGSATAAAFAFDDVSEGSRPDDLLSVTGYWEVAEEEGQTPKNLVLRQKTDVPTTWDLAVATGKGRAYGDGTSSARFKPTGGEKSVSGGIAFRVQSWKSFYAAVADGVSKTLSLVLVNERKTKIVASTPISSPKLKKWHTLEVTFSGKKMKAVFDGATTVEGEDETFSSGWAGLCVAEDAVTDFDDWKVAPSGK